MSKLLFSGDFAPLADPKPFSGSRFQGLRDVLAEADCHVTNLECPLTLSEKTVAKVGPSLKTHPEAVALLKEARVSVACLANNHAYDYGEKGLLDTIETCEREGIATLGVVHRPDGKGAWWVGEIQGRTIGVMNYCEHEFSVRGSGRIGANGFDPIRCFSEIPRLRARVDRLFVVYHGGNEYYPLPRPGLKKAFHYLADLGADAVIGHHTHVVSGFELYEGKPLVYGLGNFYFPWADETPEWYTGLLFEYSLEEDRRFRFIPLRQAPSGEKVTLLSESEKGSFFYKMESLSEIIRNDGALDARWDEFVGERSTGYLRAIPGVGPLGKILMKLGFPIKRVLRRPRMISAYNALRCQSHLDIIVDSLRKRIGE